jgi:glycosyltransferase involved in cell wall biosynthesis
MNDHVAYGRVAVLVPCYNEETAISQVIKGFRAALPEATIYVYDNNSSDRTADVARATGAVVRRETHQGKGHVVRRMFTDVEADVYVLVDGDGTYDSSSARFDDGLWVRSASRYPMRTNRRIRGGEHRRRDEVNDREN